MPTRLESVLLLATLTGLTAPTRAQTGSYTLTDVGLSLPRQSVAEMGLSDTGFVVSSFFDAAGHYVGYRWTPGARGAPSSISLFDPPPGVAWSDYDAVDVNDSGAVVGRFGVTPGSLRRGYMWKDGASRELLSPGGFQSFPQAINNAGFIVGFTGERPGAVRWTPDLVASFVADLEAAQDVNEQGWVVGYRLEGTRRTAHGYLWDGTALVPLGSLDPDDRLGVYPNALDNQGRVVGASHINGVAHAFLWTASVGMRELAGLPNADPTLHATALDINDEGWIVGRTPDASGIHYVLWGPDGTLHNLEAQVGNQGPNWSRLFWALRINSSGQVAGGELLASGTGVRPVLLTPAPLTASALVPGTIGVSNSLTVDGARPGMTVLLFADLDDGLDQGYTRIPGCAPRGLALARPRFVSAALADGAGRSTHAWLVPATLAGLRVRIQAFQFGGCALSNVVRAAF